MLLLGKSPGYFQIKTKFLGLASKRCWPTSQTYRDFRGNKTGKKGNLEKRETWKQEKYDFLNRRTIFIKTETIFRNVE